MKDIDQAFEDAFDDDDIVELFDDDDDDKIDLASASKQQPPPSVTLPGQRLPSSQQQPPPSSQGPRSGWSVSPIFSSSPPQRRQPPSSPATTARFSKPASQTTRTHSGSVSRPPSQTFRSSSSFNTPSTQASNNRNKPTSMTPSQSRITHSNQTTLTRNYNVGTDPGAKNSNSWDYTSNSQLAQDTTPTHHELDESMLSIYIYPTNLSVRDYQMAIIKRALFENVLCALPTGLGKTFIASTVMLNYYRWTRTGKIVFMAPTRPLVSQQLEACLGITGLPRSDSSILIGSSLSPIMREEEWATKRVFFATPQTVDNDLKRGIVDPKSIACLVIDEAHRATGNHAYVNVTNFIARFNQSFRVLALTATPSTTLEGVQAIITNLHISRAEIRTEDSPDISKYVHKKDITRLVSSLSDDQLSVLEPLCRALTPLIRELSGANVLHVSDPANLNQFVAVSAMKTVSGRFSNNPVKFKYLAILKVLASMGHAVNLLKYHGIRPFYNFVQSFERDNNGGVGNEGSKTKKKPGKHVAALLNNEAFQACVTACEKLIYHGTSHHIVRDRFLGHPKLEELVRVVREFFVQSWALEQTDSKAIIFSAYRDSGAEIERVLKVHVPQCRPHLFIGQAAGKGDGSGSQGTGSSSGMSQKEQQRVVEQFKAGTINTLIATSIGEEGLDIGEVDLIICYDASSSPIRMLQRMGRTGRKRAGKIYMLLIDNEEKKLDKSFDNYKYIQKLIQENPETEDLEFCKRHRMLPQDVVPECVEMKIDIPEENKELLAVEDIVREAENAQRERLKKNKGRPLKRASKKFNMPDGVVTGFVSAGTGKRLGSNFPDATATTPKKAKSSGGQKKNKTGLQAFFDNAADDDDDDKEGGNDSEEESGYGLSSSFINDEVDGDNEPFDNSDEDPFGRSSADSSVSSKTRVKPSTVITASPTPSEKKPTMTVPIKDTARTKAVSLPSSQDSFHGGGINISDTPASTPKPNVTVSTTKRVKTPPAHSSVTAAAATAAPTRAPRSKATEQVYYYDAQRDGADYGVHDQRAPTVPRAERATSAELRQLSSSSLDSSLLPANSLISPSQGASLRGPGQRRRTGTQSIISRHFSNVMQRLHNTSQASVVELERNLVIEDCIIDGAAPPTTAPAGRSGVVAGNSIERATETGTNSRQRKRISERRSEVVIEVDSDSDDYEEQQQDQFDRKISNNYNDNREDEEEDDDEAVVVRRRIKSDAAANVSKVAARKKQKLAHESALLKNQPPKTTLAAAVNDMPPRRPKQPKLEALFDSDEET